MRILLGADQYPEYINGAATFTARLAAGLAALGDDDVDAGLHVALADHARQRRADDRIRERDARQVELGTRGIDRGLAVRLLRDVALHEHASDVARDRLALVGLHVGHHHLGAVGREHPSRAFAQARGGAGDDENLAFDLHACVS